MARRKLASDDGPKRGYGQGSVYEETEGSNRWIASLDGTRRRAKSEAEARQKLKQLQERRDNRLNLKQGSMTVAEWLETWLADYCDHLKQKTREGYERAIRGHITPHALANVRLEALAADDIVQWLKTLRRKPSKRTGAKPGQKLSEASVSIPYRCLRAALNVAVDQDIITKNPTLKVKAPAGTRQRSPIVLTEEQIGRLLATWEGHRLYALFAVAALTGVRRSELLGLRWRDVELDNRLMHICGQLQLLQPDPSKPRVLVYVPSAKTAAGHRTIDLSVELVATLRLWRAEQAEERLILGKAWAGEDYIFTNEVGRPYNPKGLYIHFKAGLKRAGLPVEMTIHDLRHCAGSLMLARGEDISAVSELLGHSSRAVTERIYAHALRDRKKRAGESLGFLLRKQG